jgi:hypothetical protein
LGKSLIILVGLFAGAALIIDPVTGALGLAGAVAVIFLWQRRARLVTASATPN